jgi:hypothetical protein
MTEEMNRGADTIELLAAEKVLRLVRGLEGEGIMHRGSEKALNRGEFRGMHRGTEGRGAEKFRGEFRGLSRGEFRGMFRGAEVRGTEKFRGTFRGLNRGEFRGLHRGTFRGAERAI